MVRWLNAPQVLFKSANYGRGIKYARDGRVRKLDTSTDCIIRGDVVGSRARPYKVVIAWDEFNPDEIDLECSCPIGWKCKHTAATMVSLILGIGPRPRRVGNTDAFLNALPDLYIPTEDDYRVRIDTRLEWFQVGVEIDVNGNKLSLLPILLQALHDPRIPLSLESIASTELEHLCVPLPNGETLAVPTTRLRPLIGILTSLYNSKDDKLPMTRLVEFGDWIEKLEARVEGEGAEFARKMLGLRKTIADAALVPLPEDLGYTLRDYQHEGITWLNTLAETGLGGILADDMGLGKTIQGLCHIARHSGSAPSLVVCPTSVLDNWIDEAARALPKLRVIRHHGANRGTLLLQACDLVVTSYALARIDSDTLSQISWNVVLLDEAQMAKNIRTKTYRTLINLRAKQRLCLTGTPVENHLGELWALCNWAVPGLLGGHAEFKKGLREIVESNVAVGMGSDALNRIIRPFVMRRTKGAVAKELPPKTEIIRSCELGPKQRDLYETVRVSMDRKVRRAVEERGIERSSFDFLQALTRLRQVCCDPQIVELDEAKQVHESAKREALREMLPTLIEEGSRVLVFSQFVKLLNLVEQDLDELDIPYVMLTGATQRRKEVVDAFQRGDAPVFLISLKAGGTGLNLTAADTVIHLDPWWNPAAEDQATDRAHRIGQDKPVFVYKLIARNTLEERIIKMQEHKRTIAGIVEGAAAKSMASLKVMEELLAPF